MKKGLMLVIVLGLMVTTSWACEVQMVSDFVKRQNDFDGHMVVIDAPGVTDDIQLTLLWSGWYLDFIGVYGGTNCSKSEVLLREGYLREVTISCTNMHKGKDFGSERFTRYLFDVKFHALRFGTSYVTVKRLKGDVKGCVTSSAKVVVN